MNNFFKHLQPTIIQATMDEELPERVRGRFFINFNVFGIRYFDEHYILQETSFGAPYLILKEDNWGLQLEDTSEGELIDIPRIFIDITDKFVNDEDGLFQSFVTQALMDNKVWVRGIDNFFAGMDFYLNYTLYNYLALTDQVEVPDFGARLPNYLDSYGFIQTKYWKDLSGEIYENYNNIEYFNEKNNLKDTVFSEQELNDFYSTFCGLILKYTRIDPERLASGNNPIYNLVLNYYKNYKSDCASDALAIILNSGYGFSETVKKVTCGCNSLTSSDDSSITPSCYDLYHEAMQKWLIQMLGDYNFYEDWFYIWKNEQESMPNDILIDNLKQLINEFINQQHLLTYIKVGYKGNCECPAVSFDENECNYNILKNYLKILDWCFEEKIDANVNKTKIYGNKFGELLPKLQF